jgi:hypothetical protein
MAPFFAVWERVGGVVGRFLEEVRVRGGVGGECGSDWECGKMRKKANSCLASVWRRFVGKIHQEISHYL